MGVLCKDGGDGQRVAGEEGGDEEQGEGKEGRAGPVVLGLVILWVGSVCGTGGSEVVVVVLVRML